VTSPYPLIATRSPTTKTVPLNQLPTGPGGLATYDEFSTDRENILADAGLVAISTVLSYQVTLANAAPGTIHDVYCRDGIQPERLTITARTDIYLAYCMPDVPVIGGVYGIEGDGHRPVLVPDAMCDVQGLT
jgi:hypothetical protein